MASGFWRRAHEYTHGAVALTAVGIIVGGIWAYWPSLVQIHAAWRSDPDYSHGYLVIPLSLLLLFSRRSDKPAGSLGVNWGGLVLVASAGLLRYAAGRFYLPEFDAWSIPLWIGGICWTFLGWPTFRWALPSIAFLWFATPLPSTIALAVSLPLQKLAAHCSGIVLTMLAQPAIVEGTTIRLGDHLLEVERACSGLRMFYGVMALASAVVLLLRPSRWTSIGLLAAAIPVAILVNVARIVGTGLLENLAPSLAEAWSVHDLSGFIAIPIAIGMFFCFVYLVRFIGEHWRDNRQQVVHWTIGAATFSIVLVVAGLYWYRTQSERAPSMLIAAAREAEQQGDAMRAASYLGQYVKARPQDTEQLAHLASVLAKADTFSARIRAAELYRSAYRREPRRMEWALLAIRLAAQSQDFNMALQLVEQLQKGPFEKNQEVVDLRAEILWQYLNSPAGARQTDYTWDNVKLALEQAVAREDYSVRLAVALAIISREFLLQPAADERNARADALINQLIEDHPDNAYAWFSRYQYGRRYWEKSTAAEIDAALNQAVSKSRSAAAGEQVEILLAAAHRSLEAGSIDAARDFYHRAIEAQPTAPQPYLALAELEARNGTARNRGPQLKVLQEGVEATDGQSLELVLELASVHSEQGSAAEASQLLSPLRSLLPQIADNSIRQYLIIGLAFVDSIELQQQGTNVRAAEILEQALAKHDRQDSTISPEANRLLLKTWHRLAMLYRNTGRFDQAVAASRNMLKCDPNSVAGHRLLAEAALMNGDQETAIDEYQRCVDLQPQSGGAWLTLAAAQLQAQLRLPSGLRDLEEVRNAISKAESFAADATELLVTRVDLLRAEQKLDDADLILQDALKINPKSIPLWKSLCVLQLARTEPAKALKSAEQFAQYGGDSWETATLQARALFMLDRGDEAMKRLASARSRLRGQRQLFATMTMATIEIDRGRTDLAKALLAETHHEHPHELPPLEFLARIALDEQNWNDLQRHEEFLRELEGPDGSAWKTYRAIRLLSDGKGAQPEQVAAADELLRQVQEARPDWAVSQYLAAHLALRQGDQGAALPHLLSAWRRGIRNNGVAAELANAIGRDHGRYYSEHVGFEWESLPFESPMIFDRLLPVLVQSGKLDQSVEQARQWSVSAGDDPDAFVRLGRALFLAAGLQSNREARDRMLAQADAAFHEAVRRKPNSTSALTSLFVYYLRTGRTSDAEQLLDRIAKDADVRELERHQLLAELYLQLQRPRLGIVHMRRAVAEASEADPETHSRVLFQAARHFAPTSPKLAERYCRESMRMSVDAVDSKELLATLLMRRGEEAAIQEALELAQQLTQDGQGDPGRADRLLAKCLSIRNEPGDNLKSITLLESLPHKERDDRLLLAKNYTQVGRNGAAYDILDELVSMPDARLVDLLAFLEFWREHFQKERRFEGQAQQVLERLGRSDGGLPLRLQWQIRLAKADTGSHNVESQDIDKIIDSFWTEPAAKRALMDQGAAQRLLQEIFAIMLQEGEIDRAIELCRRPPGGLSKSFAVRLIANTLMVQSPVDARLLAAVETQLDEASTADPDELPLLQDAGDLAALNGKAERAVKFYEQVLSKDPTVLEVKSNLVALLSDREQNRSDALRIVNDALEANPRDSSLLSSKGRTLLKLKRPKEAVQVLTEAAALEPSKATVYLNLAVAHDLLGNRKAAEDALLTTSALGIDLRPIPINDREKLRELRASYRL